MALTLKTNEVMRQIRHLLTMAALAVMGAMMAGCASEDNIIADPQQPAREHVKDAHNGLALVEFVRADDAQEQAQEKRDPLVQDLF